MNISFESDATLMNKNVILLLEPLGDLGSQALLNCQLSNLLLYCYFNFCQCIYIYIHVCVCI